MEDRSTLRTDVELGARVAQLRHSAGLSQAALGEVLGLDQSAVSRIESGERELDVQELLTLCAHLRIDPSAILRAENPEEVLLRATDTDSPAVRQALEVFDRVISTFWSARALTTVR